VTDDPETAGDERDVFYDALEAVGRPVLTASRYAQEREISHEEASDRLGALAESGDVSRLDVSEDPVVWYPGEWQRLTDRERVVLFPERREVVADQPEQFTRAQLSQFAHLADTTGSGAYLYRIRREDVWQAPYDTLDGLLETVRDVLPERSSHLEDWLGDQWRRANQFTLQTRTVEEGGGEAAGEDGTSDDQVASASESEDSFAVLEAETPELMGNVARQELDDGQLRAPLSETVSWVAEERIAELKRTLYEAGYPVSDERDLDSGEHLPIDLDLELRGYQQEWVSRFLERKAGVLVGPPGSGKTVATLGILDAVEGETLVLVPGRELVGQWRDELLAHTSLTPDQVGEYHGGTKEIRPVTIATYRTAGMDRHRQLFDSREWGLIVYDEVHHVPSPVYRRSANLQTRHRLGLSVDGDTVLPVHDGDELQMMPIRELASSYLGEATGVAPAGDVRTLSVTDKGKIRWTTVESVMRHSHGGEMYRVRARNGRQIRVTSDHSLMVFDGDQLMIRSKRPEELSESDYLLQPATVPVPEDEKSQIDVLKRLDDDEVDGMDRYPDDAVETGRSIKSGVSNRQRLNDDEVALLTERSEEMLTWFNDSDVAFLEIGSVERTETEKYVYDISTTEENFLGNHLFCHNSSTPVREDDREEEIYTLIGPPIGTDWDALFDEGYVAEPAVEIRYVPWAEDAQNEYVGAEGHQRRQVAATNSAKRAEIEHLLTRHPESKALVFVEYLEQGRAIAADLDAPFVSGETPHHRREKLFEQFRDGAVATLVVSRVGDEGIDLPSAQLAVVASGLGSSRRQGAQRAGRTMRPTGSARMYVLATRGTREEEFARQRTRHLAEKGVRVTERDAETVE